MKPATPILRNEHYLDVMTGGSASLPSPILREERYLAKLAGMEVNIPNPVTIKEKYYAKICGMDVDVPTYTRNMPRIYAYMAKAAGQTIEDLPTAVTREQRYWFDYVSEPPVTEHEYTGAVPYTFNANGSPLISWRISGNTVQNGTPSPQNPVMPNGTGERTGNLFDELYPNISSTAQYKSIYVGDGEYTLSSTVTRSGGAAVLFLLAGSTTSGISSDTNGVWEGQNRTVTAIDGYITIAYRAYTEVSPTNSQTMLNTGSTALPYEPFGVKIPISSASTTTPVYLGEVQSTRRIRKLVLDSTESTWRITGTGELAVEIPVNAIAGQYCFCSHYKGTNVTSLSNLNDKECEVGTLNSFNKQEFVVYDTDYSTAADFKSYLAQQYANGTPVTVWYVLAEPETGIVNEPLMKIGEYADTLSMEQAGVSIPTNNGSTTVDVETTLKPSEVYIKWKGV